MAASVCLSVVIPVLNEERYIGKTLAALVEQDYPKERYELLVVDGMSTDGTRAVVEEFARRHADVNLRLLDNPAKWSSAARNIGVRAAEGRLIAVIDAHVFLPGHGLFAAMERLQEEHAALCLARPAPLLVPEVRHGMPFWIALARKSWLGHSPDSFIYSDYEGFVDPTSSGFAYAREVFDRVGYFDESFDAAEDCEFHHRLKKAGIRAYTSPDLTIYSYPRQTLGGLFRQMVRYGRGRVRLLRKHADTFSVKTLLPAGFLLACGLGALLAWFSAWLAMLVLAVLGAYVVTLVVASLAIAVKQRDPAILPWLPAVFATVHVGAGVGLLWEVVFPRSTNRRRPFPWADS